MYENISGIDGTFEEISQYIRQQEIVSKPSIETALKMVIIANNLSEPPDINLNAYEKELRDNQERFGIGGNLTNHYLNVHQLVLTVFLGFLFDTTNNLFLDTPESIYHNTLINLGKHLVVAFFHEHHKMDDAIWCLSKRCFELTKQNKEITVENLRYGGKCACFERIDKQKCGKFKEINDLCKMSNDNIIEIIKRFMQWGFLSYKTNSTVIYKINKW